MVRAVSKRIIFGVVSVLLILLLCLGHTGITAIDDRMVMTVYAGSSTVRLSKTLSSCGIPEISRPAGEGLWTMRVGGKKVFCLNPGKSLHNQDTAKGKKISAVNYKDQALAKVLTYYFGVNGQKGGTKLYALCQAYAWAAGEGKNKKTAMLQAASACGASASYARDVYKAIDETVVYGNIWYYTVDHCRKGGGGSGHQHLIGWEGARPGQTVQYDSVADSLSGEIQETTQIHVEKRDSVTGSLLDTAEFAVYRDGIQVATVRTANGVAEYTHTETYTAEVEPSKKYVYVLNWNALSRTEQEAEKQKGYYSSEASALSGWQSDMQPRLQAALESKKNERHQWRVAEITAPSGHMRDRNPKEQWEEAGTGVLSYTFYDAPVYRKLRLQKKSSREYGAGASLKGAVYGLYAAETVYRTDNKTVAYEAGRKVAELCTDSQGMAVADGLLPGRYRLQEISPPGGFCKDEKSYALDLTFSGDTMPEEQRITVYDEPIYGRVKIKKTFAGKDIPTQFVTKKQPREGYEPGLCAHHTAHDETCGYVAEQKGHACNHVHTQDCYTQVLICEKEETKGHIHDDSCYDEAGELTCGHEESEGHTHTPECYEKKEACRHEHNADCQYAAYREGKSCTWVCEICAFEEVLMEEELPITDTFELVDAQGKVVDRLKIAAEGADKGNVLSKEIPYGTYTLRQTASTKQYAKVPTQMIEIRSQGQLLQLVLDDKRDETGFFLTKTKSIHDAETGTEKKKAEEGAEFEVYAPDGHYLRTIKTDKNGIAYSGNLDSQGTGTYTVKQVKGAADYTLLTPQQIEVKQEKTIVYAEYDNTYCGSKIRIQKYKEKKKKEPEPEAEFTLLDAALVEESLEELSAKKTAEERTEYILSLKKHCPEAIIAVLTTGNDGKAVQILENWIYETHPEEFILYQTNGEEGYLLTDSVHARDLEQTVENGIHVYSFTATDLWDDWADISLQKQMTVSDSTSVWESGAVFALVNAAGETLDQQTTDENGYLCFKKVDFGSYTVKQVSGDNRHTLCEPVFVTLTDEHRHAEVAANAKPVTDKEKEIRFELTKTSADTGIPVNGARYQLYRILPGEEGADNREEFIANLVTGTAKKESTEEKADGKAVQYLPYGQYVLREVYPADGYTLNEESYTFRLDADSVDYDEEGNGSFSLAVSDSPVMGAIAVEKTGQVLTRYEKDSQSFVSAKEPLDGAVYGLYARETITKDDGTTVHEKDALIDQKQTDESGYIRFTRREDDGQITDRFYLGKYYIKEIKAPEGYVRDEKETEVVLDWDNKTDQFDDLRKTENTPETEDPLGNLTTDSQTGRYMLSEGKKVNQIIKEAKSVTFTWEKAPAGVKTASIDKDNSGSIVWWREGDDYYISTQTAGQVIWLHPASDHMFASCQKLEKIRFKNVDTAKVTDMSYMFYRCRLLETLDLSSFNTVNTENMRCMFAYCAAVKRIYVNGQKLKRDPVFETDTERMVMVVPKREFAVGHRYLTDDFLYYLYYTNGKAEEIVPKEADVKIEPHTATEAGEKTVQLTFTASGPWHSLGTTETNVVVKEVTDQLKQTWQEPEILLTMTDELKKVSLQVVKADEKDAQHEMLAGAEFTLYAACDIVDRKGKLLCKKDDVIARQITGGDKFSYLEFINLPTESAKKDKNAPYMYYIRETKAPDGYEKTDRVVYCTGKAGDDTVAEWVYGWSGYADSDSKTAYTGSEDWLFTNRKKTKVQLKKEWSADSENMRPESLPVSITLPDGSRKTYTLRAKDGWMLSTDIDTGVFAGYSAAQIRAWFTEQMPEQVKKLYEETDSAWDPKTGTYTFRNRGTAKITSTVTKLWEDGEDQEGLRPKTITAELYQNDTKLCQVTLPYEGKWTYTKTELPVADPDGNIYHYTWKEADLSETAGDPKKGYLAIIRQEEDSPDTTIINYHEVDTIDLSVEKIWDDSDNAQKIRPEKISVQLLANESPVQMRLTENGYVRVKKEEKDTTDRVVLSAENQWKTTVRELPVTDEAGDIDYRWQEIPDDANWITGESTIGYVPTYSTDKTEPRNTRLTNTHQYTDGGSVLIHKKIAVNRFSTEVADPVFTFTLDGEDVYGRPYTQKKEVTFTAEDQNTADSDGYIVKTILFEKVPYGTYTVTESGMEGIYEWLECLPGENAVVEKTGQACCRVRIGPTLEEAKAPGFTVKELYQAQATFENAATRGSIRLKKYTADKKSTLSGVTFVLTDHKTKQTIQKTTDEHGEVTFPELMPGQYTVTEIKTADGHSLLKEPIEITLPCRLMPEEAKELNADTKKAVAYEGNWYFYDLVYEVTNDAILRLPMTGQKGAFFWYLCLCICGGLCLLAGIHLRKRRDNMSEKVMEDV